MPAPTSPPRPTSGPTCPRCLVALPEADAAFCPACGARLGLTRAATDVVAAAGPPGEVRARAALSELLERDEVEDVYILGPQRVVVSTAQGSQEVVGLDLGGEDGLLALLDRVLAPQGKRLCAATPVADGRLWDGSRLHAAVAPCAEPAPQVVIRRARPLFDAGDDRLRRLIELGTLTPRSALLLRQAMRAGASVLVAGATASGKTTLIAALGAELPPLCAAVCIEDVRELTLPGANVAYLTARPAGPDGLPAVSARFLVQQALRKRPRWIILGEARGPEAWDFAQAGNTGHAVLASVHANGCRDALERYRDLCLTVGQNLAETLTLRNVLRAFRLVVFVEHDPRLRRRVVRHIADVTGNVTEGNVAVLQHLFAWEDGALRCTRSRPYPALERLLSDAGLSYETVVDGKGIPPTWQEAARRGR